MIRIPHGPWTRQVDETYDLPGGYKLYVDAYYSEYMGTERPDSGWPIAYTVATGTLDGTPIVFESNAHSALEIEPQDATAEELQAFKDKWKEVGFTHHAKMWKKWGNPAIWDETVPEGLRWCTSSSSPWMVMKRRELRAREGYRAFKAENNADKAGAPGLQ